MRVIALVATVCATSLPAIAQTPMTNDLTPTIKPQRYRICNDRPERPAWAEELHIREAWKKVTLMELYEVRAWESIASTQDCSCDTRFPEWLSADEEYRERYIDLSQGEQTALRRDLRMKQRTIAGRVQSICEAQDNW